MLKEEFSPYNLEHIADIKIFMAESEKAKLLKYRQTEAKPPKKGILAPSKKKETSLTSHDK